MASGKYRIPKQKRSIEKKKLIRKAALKLFSEKGYYNTTTNEIAAEAGVSIGTLYSYYPDKKLVYEETVKELYREVMDTLPMPDITAGISPQELLKTLIRTLIAEHEHEQAFQKQIHTMSLADDEFCAMEESNKSLIRKKIISIINLYRPADKIQNIDTIAFIIQNTIEATVHDIVFYRSEFDSETVIEELSEMICGYVLNKKLL